MRGHMKIIYSRWDIAQKRWRSKPAADLGAYGILCAKTDHSECTHQSENGLGAFSHVTALRNMAVESIVFTKETCIVRLVPA